MSAPALPMAPTALQLTGSTTMQPRMQRVAESYMGAHDARIVVNGGCGTARGYKALLDGVTDIAMASGAQSDVLSAEAAARGLAFDASIVSRDAIVPVVHPSNPVSTLTLRQLGNIFTGRTASWHAFGGPDEAIEVLVGPPTGGVSISWRRLVLGDEDTYTPSCLVLDAAARLARVATRPFAISFMPEAAVAAARVKLLRVDGIAADLSPLRYPLHAPMMLVTLGPPTPAMARFIAYAVGAGAPAVPGAPRE
jgi:phosphate transport system substrate-binding protein